MKKYLICARYCVPVLQLCLAPVVRRTCPLCLLQLLPLLRSYCVDLRPQDVKHDDE